ncbi:MAG: holo-ACP synthase [Anaerolineales bacterium]
MHLRSGVDLISLQRFDEALRRHGQRLLMRLFTATEIEQSGGRVASLAARFAAKEAAAKALGCGIGEVGWREIEVTVNEKGAPHLRFYGNAAQKIREQKWQNWSLSLSHTEEAALAMLIVLCEDSPN